MSLGMATLLSVVPKEKTGSPLMRNGGGLNLLVRSRMLKISKHFP